MSAKTRVRCPGCRQTFRRRADAEEHWARTCSPAARAKRTAQLTESRHRLDEVERNLDRMAREREADESGRYGRVVGDWASAPASQVVQDLNELLNQLWRGAGGGSGPQLAPPDLLEARPGPDGTYTTE